MKPIPAVTRQAVLALLARGAKTSFVARKFGCSESWVRRVRQQYRETGKTAPATTRRRVPEWRRHENQIRKLVSQNPSISLRQLEQSLERKLSRQTLSIALRELGLTPKRVRKQPDQ